jgi:hypothetical protein
VHSPDGAVVSGVVEEIDDSKTPPSIKSMRVFEPDAGNPNLGKVEPSGLFSRGRVVKITDSSKGTIEVTSAIKMSKILKVMNMVSKGSAKLEKGLDKAKLNIKIAAAFVTAKAGETLGEATREALSEGRVSLGLPSDGGRSSVGMVQRMSLAARAVVGIAEVVGGAGGADDAGKTSKTESSPAKESRWKKLRTGLGQVSSVMKDMAFEKMVKKMTEDFKAERLRLGDTPQKAAAAAAFFLAEVKEVISSTRKDAHDLAQRYERMSADPSSSLKSTLKAGFINGAALGAVRVDAVTAQRVAEVARLEESARAKVDRTILWETEIQHRLLRGIPATGAPAPLRLRFH